MSATETQARRDAMTDAETLRNIGLRYPAADALAWAIWYDPYGSPAAAYYAARWAARQAFRAVPALRREAK